jgi:hypothetical protein
MKNLVIIFGETNPIISEAVQKLLFQAGYKWGGRWGGSNPTTVGNNNQGALFAYESGKITYADEQYGRQNDQHGPLVDLTKEPIIKLIELLEITPVRVKLNSAYTAEVSEDKKTVKVGCQTFDSTKIKELAKLLE